MKSKRADEFLNSRIKTYNDDYSSGMGCGYFIYVTPTDAVESVKIAEEDAYKQAKFAVMLEKTPKLTP